jgi:L-lactate dehydrogenase
MTHVAARFAARSGVRASRVLGSGTTLDTARFRALLGRHFGVDPPYVHGYVVGEHGDSEVLVWSQATIAGLGLDAFATVHGTPLTPQDRQRIDDNVRRAADHIIAGKGGTWYGIGCAVARIVDVLVHDQRAILTICGCVSGVPDCDGVTLALPHLIGGEGVLATIPLALADTERDGLRRSARILRDAVRSLQLDF